MKPPTTTLARPATLHLSPNLTVAPISSSTRVPPPLTVLKPNGIQFNGLSKTDLGDVRLDNNEKLPSLEPVLTIPSLSTTSTNISNVATIAAAAPDNQGLPLIRVPPALPTITISLPSSSQLVKQEKCDSSERNLSLMPPLTPIVTNHVSLPSMPLPKPKDLSKNPLNSLRPTTLNIPKPLGVPTILMPKEASTDSSLLSLANVSAVQNHLPVVPTPTRHHLPGVNTINHSSASSSHKLIANHVPSLATIPSTTTTTTRINKNDASNSCAIGPLASVSGLPAGLTITANTIIKQEIPNEDIITNTNAIPNSSNHISTINVNGNQITQQQTKSNKRKSGKAKTVALEPPTATKIEGSNQGDDDNDQFTDEEDSSAANDLDLTGLTNEERRKVLRRQRNKEAAARCRKRRLDQTLGLQEQVDQWIEHRNELQREINQLQHQETELQNILNLHQLTNCRLKNNESNNAKQIKSSIVTTLEREAAEEAIISGGLGRLAAVAAAVSNSMKMAKEVEESSINLTMEKKPRKISSTTSTNNQQRKDSL